MASLRNIGGGRYQVIDGNDVISDPVSYNEGVNLIAEHERKKQLPKPGTVDIREYERRLAEAQNQGPLDLGGKVARLLAKECGDEAAALMMRQILPILRQGGKGQRRESVVARAMTKAAAKPAA